MAFTDRLHNRGSISTGYEIENSLKLESDNAEYLYYTPSGQTDYERMAFSIWLKRTELSTSQRIAEFGNGTSNTSNLRIGFDTSDRLFCYGNSIIWRQTNQVFRDTSAWYHLFFLFDTTTPGGISNNRIRIWVNGEMIPHTEFGVINNPGSGAAMGFNNSLQQSIGAQREGGPTGYFNGYIAQVYGSGGTPPVVTDFGEFDQNAGIWKPIDISELTPPDTAGFNLDFSDASSLGNDISSRNNNFTLQNITSSDQATDTPTNNFCTGNNLVRFTNPSSTVVVDGATFMQKTANGRETISGTMYASSGKWYAEVQPIYPTGNNFLIGVMPSDSPIIYLGGQISNFPGSASGDGGVSYISTGNKYLDGGNSSYGNAYSSGTSVGPVIGIALDMDNGKVYFSISNVWQNSGDPTSGATGTGAIDLPSPEKSYSFHASIYNNGNSVAINYGGYTYFTISSGESDANGYGTFEYAPPSGYYALCSKNLAEFG